MKNILKHISSDLALNTDELNLFVSILNEKVISRKQLLDKPGIISKHRNYILQGAFRSFIIDNNGFEQTVSLAIDDGWTGDAVSFNSQKPSNMYVEAVEKSTVLQWNYKDELMLFEKIPAFNKLMMKKTQEIGDSLQQRLIFQITSSAEQRYEKFLNENPMYFQRFPLHIIASYLGMSREFLSKIRNSKINNSK